MKLKSVYYGANINIVKGKKGSQENIFNLYKLLNVNCIEGKDGDYINPYPLDGTITSKKASYQELTNNGIRKVASMPPIGPLREYTYCPYCKKHAPGYHDEECPGPYDDEIIIPGEGYRFYIDKISTVLSEEDLEELDVIYYRDIYPQRGIQKNVDENQRNHNFSNVLQLIYNTDGIRIPVKVTPYYGITLRNVPYSKNTEWPKFGKTIYKLIIQEHLDDKFDNENSWVTNINGTFEVCGKDQKLDLETLFSFIKNLNYSNIYEIINSTLRGYISLRIKYEVEKDIFIKAVVSIRRGGSVSVYLSYGLTASDAKLGLTLLNSDNKKYLDYKTLESVCSKINQLVFRQNDFCIVSRVVKRTKQDIKIMNTSIPYKLSSKGLTYGINLSKDIGFPPQPSGCQNKGLESNKTTKSTIRRPVPFSFMEGRVPCRGMVTKIEGIKTSGKKLLGDREILFEPCSEPISGVEPSVSRVKPFDITRNTDLISKRDFQNMSKIDKLIDDPEELNNEIKHFISQCTSVREKFIRRMLFGFPNKLYPEDSSEYNHIKSGWETVPDLDHNEILNSSTIPLDKTKRVRQEDINSAVYVPGTQLANFGGDNTFIRDSRKFKGLMSFHDERYKPLLLEIARRCLNDIVVEFPQEVIPINFEDINQNLGDYYMYVPKNSMYQKINDVNVYNIDDIVYVTDIGKKFSGRGYSVIYPNKISGIEIEYPNENQILVLIKNNGTVYECGRSHSWHLRNMTIQFYIDKDDCPSNMVRLFYPNKEEGSYQTDDLLKRIGLFQFNNESNFLFIPSSVIKKINKSAVYKFYFNYYQEADKSYRLVPNQPLAILENIKQEGKRKVFEDVTRPESNDSVIQKLTYLFK